ncbi:MAG: hypothetical protein KJP19_09575 [Deltaproteobacteria bacterium]|nr:hypothetical protein [Deltaproteobacteria bacterium]
MAQAHVAGGDVGSGYSCRGQQKTRNEAKPHWDREFHGQIVACRPAVRKARIRSGMPLPKERHLLMVVKQIHLMVVKPIHRQVPRFVCRSMGK